MGYTNEVYLGPYVIAVNGSVTCEQVRHGCTRPSCSRWAGLSFVTHGGNFCSQCGSSLGPVPYEARVTRVNTGDLREQLNLCPVDSLSGDNDNDIWLSNLIKVPGCPRPFDRSDLRSEPLEVTPEMMAEELAAFAAAFAGDLQKLREAYTPGEVRLAWGLVLYTL